MNWIMARVDLEWPLRRGGWGAPTVGLVVPLLEVIAPFYPSPEDLLRVKASNCIGILPPLETCCFVPPVSFLPYSCSLFTL